MIKKRQNGNNKGFSLVELIVVIAIMAILIAVIAPSFLKYVNKSKKETDKTNASELQTEIQVNITSNGIDGGSIEETDGYIKIAEETSEGALVTNFPTPQYQKDSFFWYKIEVDDEDDNPVVHVAISEDQPKNEDSDIVPVLKHSKYSK